MIHSRLTRLIPLFSLTLAAQLCAASAATLASHKAYYTLDVKRIDKASGLSAVAGRLAYEIKGSDCEGYAVNYRIANRFIRGDGTDPQESDLRLTSFESGDGLSLDVQETQFVNGEAKANSRVKASRPKLDAEASADLSGDETKSFKVDAKALFPTVFQKHLVDLALSGKSRDDVVTYEGNDGEKVAHVISFIGARKTGLQLDDAADTETKDAFAKLAYWPVTMSYYPMDAEGDAQPDYQTSFNLFENGVSTDLVLDYGTYALTGKLNKIELLKQDQCK